MHKFARPAWLKVGLTGVAILVLAVLWIRFSGDIDPVEDSIEVELALIDGDRPLEVPQAGYVGSDACRSCHEEPYDRWHSSYHRTMTQVATTESVVANFDDVRLRSDQLEVHLMTRGDEFWVELPDETLRGNSATAPWVRRQIVQVTGSHHMQVYWYPSGESRSLTQLPFVYLIDEAKWIPEFASFLGPRPNSVPPPGIWNRACIDCHSTGPRPGFLWALQDTDNPRLVGVDTQVSEFGIGCEACHGPGEAHVSGHSNPQNHDSNVDIQLVVADRLEPDRGSQVCGQCHSVWHFKSHEGFMDWSRHGHTFRPGHNLEDSRLVIRANSPIPKVQELLETYPADSMIWSDGMIRISGREFNGLIESPCFKHGRQAEQMSCLSCHTMHAADIEETDLKDWANDQLKPGLRGDVACTQCHEKYGDEQHLVAHTHHAANSSGSNCYNCHMSHTTFGLLKAIRSHQISSPDVAASVNTGRPNACNQCHLNRTLAWSADYLQEWFGIDKPALSKDQSKIAASVLWTLKGDAGQRALMAWSMGWDAARQASGDEWMTPFLAELADDPYGAVRIIAYRSLRKRAEFKDLPFDPVGPARERKELLQQIIVQHELRIKDRQVNVTGSELLLDFTGRIDKAVYNRLLQGRDLKRVILKE